MRKASEKEGKRMARTTVSNGRFGDVSATVGGVAILPDQPAVVVDGRPLAPLRLVAEALGARVSWDDETQTASIVR